MPRDPVSLLGRAVGDPLVIDWLAFHGETEPFSVVEGAMATYGEDFGKRGGVALTAEPASTYEREVGEPVSRVTCDAAEMIVRTLLFMDKGCGGPGSEAYPHPPPLGLAFGDTADILSEKLGAKPVLKTKSGTLPDWSPIRFSWFWNVGDVFVVTWLTQGLRLGSFSLSPIDRRTRDARERQSSLKAESANIDPANVAAVEALRASIPTPRWREAMEDGDELFTDAIIKRATELLDRYIDEVKAATSKRSAPRIHAATKRLVLALNKLNEAKGSIETLERDELGELIDGVIRSTGFRLKEGEDLTAQWREW